MLEHALATPIPTTTPLSAVGVLAAALLGAAAALVLVLFLRRLPA